MRTVLNGPLPAEVDDLLTRRRALGLDIYDEVWNGEYHVNPSPNARHGHVQAQLAELLGPLLRAAGLTPIGAFNLGIESNYRVPDLGALRRPSARTWVDDAAIVVEVRSPGDESFDKFDHFAEFGVVEVLIVDPVERQVQVFTRTPDSSTFTPTDTSALLGVDTRTLDDRIDWI